MPEHRDSPELDPDQDDDEPRTTASRRFARMVESPTSRRVALPRLLTAVGLTLLLVGLIVFGGSKLVIRGVGWVAARPENQIRFSDIELVPSPEPWVVGGKSRILEEVRADAQLEENLSLLDLDLTTLARDFKLCAWVKDVVLIERSYGHLTVHLAYRKPVAVVDVLDHGKPVAYPIDEEAVALPPDDIDWTSTDRHPPFRVRGISESLIEIKNVQSSARPKFGLPWRRGVVDDPVMDRDPMVPKAARLAEFLQRQSRSTPKGRLLPSFESIYLPVDPEKPFFLVDSLQNLVKWGKAPGDEKPGEPSVQDRWKMLGDWVDLNGPINAKNPDYLEFARSGAQFVDGKLRKKP